MTLDCELHLGLGLFFFPLSSLETGGEIYASFQGFMFPFSGQVKVEYARSIFPGTET